MNLIKTLPLDYLSCTIYPRLYALHTLSEQVSFTVFNAYTYTQVFIGVLIYIVYLDILHENAHSRSVTKIKRCSVFPCVMF